MLDTHHKPTADSLHLISFGSSGPPVSIPRDHVGPVALPGTGRLVWWTGRVAIGLRHVAVQRHQPTTQSTLWVQALMLDRATQADCGV